MTWCEEIFTSQLLGLSDHPSEGWRQALALRQVDSFTGDLGAMAYRAPRSVAMRLKDLRLLEHLDWQKLAMLHLQISLQARRYGV